MKIWKNKSVVQCKPRAIFKSLSKIVPLGVKFDSFWPQKVSMSAGDDQGQPRASLNLASKIT